MNTISSLGSLRDPDLLRQLGELVCRDQQHTAQLLRHIDEVDRRQLWAKHGHPSMFDFCVVRFNMSESMAGKRIGAARTARRFSVLFDMVARGEIHLSGIHRLKAHLTEENHGRVLAEAKHKTIKEIERLVARTLKKKAALTDTPRESTENTSKRSRSIAAAVRREVWQRDQGRCAFVGEDGHRCNATRCLEYAHAEPWGRGGRHSAANIGLRCRAHNAYEANLDYGAAFMARKRSKSSTVREPAAHYVPRRPSADVARTRQPLVRWLHPTYWPRGQYRLHARVSL